VKALIPPGHHEKAVFCLWLLAKCLVNTQLVADILFSDEARSIRDCTVKVHNTHIWVDNNPHTAVASKHQHQFSIKVCVSIIGDQLFGPIVLPNTLTDTIIIFSWAIYQYIWNMCPSSTTTHAVHAWWGTISFSPHCQTVPEPHFPWTVARIRSPSQLIYTISRP
jgi:hypothetical protein